MGRTDLQLRVQEYARRKSLVVGEQLGYGVHGIVFTAKYQTKGGQVALKNGKPQYVAIQVSEKVSVNVDLTATGKGGHSSTPTKDNPVVHIAGAVDKIGNYTAPVHLTSIVRRYFEGLAPLEDEETAK